MIQRGDIVREAREWLGTRWHHQASAKGVGTDCIGLIAGVARECGIVEAKEFMTTAEFHGYGREPNFLMLMRGCARWLDRITISGAKSADILLLRFSKEPMHFALISDADYMIHAYAQARKVVENRIDEVWRSRIYAVFSFRCWG